VRWPNAQPSSFQNSCPEHRSELVCGAHALVAPQSVVAHAVRAQSLLGDVHELEGHVVARDELAQSLEHLGVEDVTLVGRARRLEDRQQVADVRVGQHPLARLHVAHLHQAVAPE
jgi:hypothetical protein